MSVRIPLFSLLIGILGLAAIPMVHAQTTLLQADRLLDVERGTLVTPAVVVVKDGRIEAINPPTVPAADQVVDLGDVTLLPGLMDMHTHLTFDLEGDWVNRPVRETAADQALRGARNARRTLLAGFTTVRNVGAGGFSAIALKHAIEQDLVTGPDIISAGHSLGATGGHCDVTGYAPGILEHDYRSGVADGVDEVVKAVRYQIKHGAQVIKVCATAGVLSFEGPVGAQQYSQAELEAIVAEASMHGIKVAGHAHGADGILAAVRAGFASIEHGSMLTDEIFEAMKRRGTYLVPTTYLVEAINLDNLPPLIRAKAEFVLPRARESLRMAIQAGVKVAFGTDAAVFPHGDNAKEFAILVERGMTPLQAIQSATLNAADLLGREDRGRLASGLRADIIAVPGNPLVDVSVLEEVLFVMKQGTIYKRGE